MKKAIYLAAMILSAVSLLFLSSCSYGTFNFSDETGSIWLQFRIDSDNPNGVDNITLDLLPPEGWGTTLRNNLYNNQAVFSLSEMDIGSWTITGTLYSGNDAVQTFIYSPEIISGERTSLTIEAEWLQTEYDLRFELRQDLESETNSYSGGDSTTEAEFSISEIKLMPDVYEDSRSGSQSYGMNVRIKGANLSDQVSSFNMIYPDSKIYEYGNNIYNRSLVFSQEVDNSLIEVKRNYLTEENVLNGTYKFDFAGYNNVRITDTKSLDLDFEALMPHPGVSINSSIQESLSSAFDYEFEPDSGIGSRFVYIVNTSDPAEFYPQTNGMVVGMDSGTMSYPGGGTLPIGTYELIILSMEHSTTTPVDDAATAGITTPDLRSSFVVGTLYDIYDFYGVDPGYIVYSVTGFEFY